jgi:hypothetical protein
MLVHRSSSRQAAAALSLESIGICAKVRKDNFWTKMTIQKQFKCKKRVGRTPGADAGFAAVARPPYLACVELSKVITSYFRFKDNSKV